VPTSSPTVKGREPTAGVAFRKRSLDLVLGAILSLVVLPVLLVLALGVAVSLRTWPFFSQSRPGRGEANLTILKLRTLPPTTPQYADKHALGIETWELPWLCRLLRKTHLDELPQLLLVVAGRMSLVGPRPPLPSDVEPLDHDFEVARRAVRPGCTGLWQLSSASSDTATSAPDLDLFYLRNASTRLDLWILLRTVGWMAGVVAPLEADQVPRSLLGPGLTVTEMPPEPAVRVRQVAQPTQTHLIERPGDVRAPLASSAGQYSD